MASATSVATAITAPTGVSENGSREGRSRESRAAVLRDEAAPCRTVVPLKVCYFRRRQNRHQILPVPARAPALIAQRAARSALACTAWPGLRGCGRECRSTGPPAGAEAIADLGHDVYQIDTLHVRLRPDLRWLSDPRGPALPGGDRDRSPCPLHRAHLVHPNCPPHPTQRPPHPMPCAERDPMPCAERG